MVPLIQLWQVIQYRWEENKRVASRRRTRALLVSVSSSLVPYFTSSGRFSRVVGKPIFGVLGRLPLGTPDYSSGRRSSYGTYRIWAWGAEPFRRFSSGKGASYAFGLRKCYVAVLLEVGNRFVRPVFACSALLMSSSLNPPGFYLKIPCSDIRSRAY